MNDKSLPAVDFHGDWREFMLKEMTGAGYSVDNTEDDRDVSYKFFNLRKRSIFPRIRRVHRSRGFSCPPELLSSLEQLSADFEAGENINGRLSKSLLDLNYNDYLLMDWGIHHFHLGSGVDSVGFTNRSGPLLFAFVSPDDAYFIDVLPHGSWSKESLIRTIHENWPEIIADKRINNALRLAKTVSDTDRVELRKYQINTFVELEPGVIYGQLGGGYTTAGTSLSVERSIQRYREIVTELEKYVLREIDELERIIKTKGHQLSGKPNFQLHVNDRGFYALERSTNVAFLLLEHRN